MTGIPEEGSVDDGFVVGRIRNIDIRMNWSVVFIVGIVAWSLAEGLLPEYAQGYTTGEYWLTAGILAVALLGGLLAHELGHSLVAAHEGVAVSSITLWMFGGVALLTTSPKTPRSAIRIAAAGPAVSAGLGILALGASSLNRGMDGVALVGTGLGWFGAINLLLAGFNLLPAFPMDGGRIYHAWLWSRSGDEMSATRRAAALGHAIGGALVVLGLLEVLFLGLVGGVWLALIGWFVREAARAEMQRASAAAPLDTIPVSEIMTTAPQRALADGSVQSFVSEMLFGGRHAAYPVVRPDGSVVGLITVKSVRALDREGWAATTVGEAATPLARLTAVAPTASISEVASALRTDPERRALVMEDDHLVGIVSPSDIARLVTAVELAGPTVHLIESKYRPSRRGPQGQINIDTKEST